MRIMIALVLFYSFLLCLPPSCLATDTLKMGEPLFDRGDNRSANLVTAGQKFELGFFSPSGSQNRYLGIWYHVIEPRTVVWVANRDKPIPSKTASFQISPDGNLTVSGTDGTVYWSYTPQQVSSPPNLIVKLMDSGNLILGDDQSQATYWQSFQYPTDTFLLGMKMDKGLVLNSWRRSDDPGSGNYTFAGGKTEDSNYTIYINQNQVYWAGETRQDFGREGAILWLLTNYTLRSTYKNTDMSKMPPRSDFESARLVMNYTGHIELWFWDEVRGWSPGWNEPVNNCTINNYCGNFGSCNSNSWPLCRCLPGFTSKSQGENQVPPSKSRGCFRQTTLSCGQNTTFIELKNVKVRKPDRQVYAANETECRSTCLNGTGCPNCTAYLYDASTYIYQRMSTQCSIWTSALPTIQEVIDAGFNLSLAVNKLDIEPTPRTCQPCSVFTIPYPLSTEPSCGDPFYFNFTCNLTTGQVSFIVGEEIYRVTNIDPDKRSFFIHINDSEDCAARNIGPRLQWPFSMTQQCDDVEGKTLKIRWSAPGEPPCSNSIDCNGWSYSTCKAARNGNRRCLCNKKYRWNGLNLSCMPEPPRGNNSKVLILAVTFSSLIFLACIVTSAYIWRRKVTLKQENGQDDQRTRESLYDTERYIKDLMDAERLEENDSEVIEVPYLDFNTILLATDNFSDANKLGRGGYGPVYKGKLQ